MLFDHKISETPDFSVITIFTTALCNLNCSYCYICKDQNGGLKQIDDDIKECFDKGLYIKQVLDLNPNHHDTIKEISLWGGEPFLKIYRFINHLPEFFTNFPNLHRIDVSTNMTLSDHFERIQDLVKAVEENYSLLNIASNKKKFNIDIQISVDGYKEMNDVTRGVGVTDAICSNWKKILRNLVFNPNIIEINFYTKSTFSKTSWHFVDTPEKAYKWCEFFDQSLHLPWRESNSFVKYRHGMWNNAMPSEYCKADGIRYTEVTKAFRDAYEDVKKNLPSFKDYDTIIAEASTTIGTLNNEYRGNQDELLHDMKCKRCGMGCGVFSYNLVPIPHNKFTMCHRGLFDSYIDYIKVMSNQDHLNGLASLWSSIDAKKYWIFDKDQLLQMHDTINKLYEYRNQIFYTDLVQQIRQYAKSGLIDSKYENLEEIEKTIPIFLLQSQCIQDCFIFGGSWTTRTPLEIPLFYNGSMDIIVEEIENKKRKESETCYERV